MSKVFQKLRKKISFAGAPRKYMVYALGEIMLIVIGILFALQINKWNSYKNDRAKEEQILIDLKKEIELNVNLFDDILSIREKAKSTFEDYSRKLSDGSHTFEDMINAHRNQGIITFDPSTGVLNSLLSSGNLSLIRNDSLKYLLTNWLDLFKDYQEEESLQAEDHRFRGFPLFARLFPPSADQELRKPYYDLDMESYKNQYLEASANGQYRWFISRNLFWLQISLEEGQNLKKVLFKILEYLNKELEKF